MMKRVWYIQKFNDGRKRYFQAADKPELFLKPKHIGFNVELVKWYDKIHLISVFRKVKFYFKYSGKKYAWDVFKICLAAILGGIITYYFKH